MPPSGKDKNGADKDKIPVTSSAELIEELKVFKAALSIKETEHTWEALDRAVKRFTAVTRGGGCRYEADYVAGLKDRDLARAIVGCLSTERTQLSASTLLFLSAATRLGQSFSPLIFLYLPHIIRLLSRTNKLYISRATACLSVIISNTRLAGIIPYLREGMLEKSPSHRKGCLSGLLSALGGPDATSPTAKSTYEGMIVDKDIVQKKYLDDIETCIRIGARDKDTEVRKIAKKCWEIYRIEFSERVANFSAPLTPIARKYLELPPAGLPVPDYSKDQPSARPIKANTITTTSKPAERIIAPAPVRHNPAVAPPRAPSPSRAPKNDGPVSHTVQRAPLRPLQTSQPSTATVPTDRVPTSQHAPAPSASSAGQVRPPGTLFARRVLPSSTSASASVQTYAAPATHLTTFFGPREPVASTSYARPPLPKSHTTEALYQPSTEVPSWLPHQRAVTAPSAAILPEALTKSYQEIRDLKSRPASACSQASGIASSTTSPAKEPFRPSSSLGSQQIERVISPPAASTESVTSLATGAPRPVIVHQQRSVPAQAHRAPARNVRRASRVLPPSADLQAFLSSTATDAASEFKWPEPTLTHQNRTKSPDPVELPQKRPASAMSYTSTASTTVTGVGRPPMESTTRQEEPPVSNTANEPVNVPVDVSHPTVPSQDVSDSPSQTASSEVMHQSASAQNTDVSAIVPSQPIGPVVQVELPTPQRAIPEHVPRSVHTLDPETGSSSGSAVEQDQPPGNVAPGPAPAIADTHKEDGALESKPSSEATHESEPVAVASDDKVVSQDVQPAVAHHHSETICPVQTEPAPTIVDIAALVASIPTASTSRSTAARPALAARQKTAFRPQKHHSKPDTLAKDMPSLPIVHNAALHSLSKQPESLEKEAQQPSAVITSGSTHAVRNPLSASLGTGRPQAPSLHAPVPAQQPRSVSTSSVAAGHRREAGIALKSSQNARLEPVRAPVSTSSRTNNVSNGTSGPPAKKQALSSSIGPASNRPAFNAGSSRSAAVPLKPVAQIPRAATKSTASSRQGSIFSRLAAPTAASAARAKPRLAASAKETFKKPAPVTGTLSKKSSIVSLKSSHDPSGIAPRTLQDSTNRSSKALSQAASAPADQKPSAQHEMVQDQADAPSQPDVPSAAPDSRPASQASYRSTESGAQSIRSLRDGSVQSAPDLSPSENQLLATTESARAVTDTASDVHEEHRAEETLSEAVRVPLPSSVSQSQDKFHSILAELGLTHEHVPVADQEAGSRAFHQHPSEVTALPKPKQGLGASSSEPPAGLNRPSGQTDAILETAGGGLPVSIAGEDVVLDDETSADRTTIVHALEEIEDVIPHFDSSQQDIMPATSNAYGTNTSSSPSPAEDYTTETPKDAVAAQTSPVNKMEEAPIVSSADLAIPSQKSVLPQEVPLPPDISLLQDSFQSMLVSPAKGMQDLLARSTGRKAQEEGSPLLQEKEYLPAVHTGQYVYDDTVIDAYSISPHEIPEKQNSRLETPSSEPDIDVLGASTENEEEEEEEEDEIALMISRELSSNSLEELASRWEQSRVIGSLGLLDATNDDFDFENTPMRPRLLTRFSDGESSDYGQAPVDAGVYTKDDEDAALDILLSMGNQGTMGWSEKGAILTDSLYGPATEQSLRETSKNDRGILAEMSAFEETPKVARMSQTRETDRGTATKGATGSSILQEGGFF